jgi:RNA polymerase sigma-70 factor (ECF subfamily)
MQWMDESDGAAVARARAGEEEGFRVLVERHSRSVFHLAYRMTGNEHDAEEIVQETFLRAYRRLSQFQSRSSFSTWIYRIATNCSLDLMRSRRGPETATLAGGSEPGDVIERLPAEDPTPERLAFSSEVQQQVAAALNELSALERAVFVLRHFEGKSIEEIAQVVDRQADATKQSLFRAVQKLRRSLEPLVVRSRVKCHT